MSAVRILVSVSWNRYSKEFEYHVYHDPMGEYDPSCYGETTVHRQTVNFESPADADLKAQLVLAKRAQINKIKAAAYEETQNIEADIQEMLCLEAPRTGDGVL